MLTWEKNFVKKIPSIMGILNVTPDSFFDGGKYLNQDNIKKKIDQFIENSVEIIDIGGESSRPGSNPVSIKEELNRVLNALSIITKMTKIPISIDTYKPEVAKAAIENGAQIINDITGFTNDKMLNIASNSKCYIIIMHKHGSPETMQQNPLDIKDESAVINFLKNQTQIALKAGIKSDKIMIDPGIGFGKTLDLNVNLIKKIDNLKNLNYPIVLGVSRKSLIGNILNKHLEERLIGSICIQLIGALNGASIIRTHDIKETRDMIAIINKFYGEN